MEKNIYINTVLKRRLILKPEYINKNLNKNIEDILKYEVGNKCIKEGYVKEDSIKIIKRSTGKLMSINFSGNLVINVEYSADVCNPVRGNVIECTITRINKFGLQAENSPLSIIIAKQYHNNKEIFKNLTVGQKIEVLVIGKRYTLNNDVIDIIGKLTTDKDVQKTIKIKKDVEESKEMTNIFQENNSSDIEDDDIDDNNTEKSANEMQDFDDDEEMDEEIEDGEESETDMLEDESETYMTDDEDYDVEEEEEADEDEEEENEESFE